MLPSEPWLSWATVGFIAACVLAIGLAFSIRWGARRAPDAAAPPAGDAVACPACGAENDTDYRYCRSCLEELPGGSPTPLAASGPVDR